ncbi:MAG: menaquinol-cytochrome c reductase cytochrome b subunit [Actinomycetota bacterium]|nr:menaquinol-cytochrome c reductase cytochrome b subunit [Actinomycetota bacterium]
MAEIPEHILRRSAEARAKAEGRSVDEIMAELKGEAAPPAAAAASPTSTPGTPAPSGPAAETRDLEAESTATGVPVPLLERSMNARAGKEGKPVPAMAGAPASAPSAAAPAAAAAAPSPATAARAVPEGVRTQRLLTVVQAGAIQQVRSEPVDKVNVWPHLLAIEFVALLVVLVVLTVMSIFIDAPLLEFANFNEQPNPSKAPWYFLGLQELLAYFDPQVAGVILPGFGLAALAMIPYIDRNPSVRPSDRKLAIMIFTFFLMSSAVLTIFGSFFRGPGFNFTYPWRDGIFFDDLLDILE